MIKKGRAKPKKRLPYPRKIKRKRSPKKRKNYFLTSVVIIFSWLLLGLVVYFADPGSFAAILAFFAAALMALFFTLSTILANTRRGVIASFTCIIFLILRTLGIGNIVNLLLVLGLALTIEYYYASR